MLTLEKYLAFEANVQKILDGGVNTKTGVPFDVEAVDKNWDITVEEHFAYQQTQAAAHASGIISLEVAQIVYHALGEVMSSKNGGWTAGITTARKQAITQLIGELMPRLRTKKRTTV